MSSLNEQQFPQRWRPHEDLPSYNFSKCAGPGPFGAGCAEEGFRPGTGPWSNGKLVGTRFDRWRDSLDKHVCVDCGNEAVRQRDYDQAKPTLDRLRSEHPDIDANVRMKPLWDPVAEDHNKANVPWWTKR